MGNHCGNAMDIQFIVNRVHLSAKIIEQFLTINEAH